MFRSMINNHGCIINIVNKPKIEFLMEIDLIGQSYIYGTAYIILDDVILFAAINNLYVNNTS